MNKEYKIISLCPPFSLFLLSANKNTLTSTLPTFKIFLSFFRVDAEDLSLERLFQMKKKKKPLLLSLLAALPVSQRALKFFSIH
jgi:hypothetical protein